jgi:micrococcal nuclease
MSIKSKITIAILSISLLSGCIQDIENHQTSIDDTGKYDALEYEEVEVSRVIDGDTFECVLRDHEYRVRLVGVDTPELNTYGAGSSESEPEFYAEEAKVYAESVLNKGMTLYLVKDISETDKYGRLLRYVYIDLGDVGDVTLSFNHLLLIGGYADVMTISPDDTYSEVLTGARDEAKKSKIGMWSE